MYKTIQHEIPIGKINDSLLIQLHYYYIQYIKHISNIFFLIKVFKKKKVQNHLRIKLIKV